MAVTQTPPETVQAASVAATSTQRAQPTGLAAVVGSGDHKTIGRLYILSSLLLGVGVLVLGLLFGLEAMDPDKWSVFTATNGLQLFTLLRVATLFLLAFPLVIGVALVVVPLQVGAPSIAFPRAAAASFWGWFLGSILVIASYIADGGPFGTSANGVNLWITAMGLVIVSLLIASVSLATTVLALRAPGMTLDRTPLYSWSVAVATIMWIITLPVLVGFIVQVAHHVASPDLAEARNARDARALQRTLRKAVVLPAAATLAITVLAVLFGSTVLSLFGPDFAHGGPVLAVLIGAQAVPALAGPSVTMMTLSGAQRDNAVLCGVALAALAIACFVLIPKLGAFGAALAVLITMIVWQLAVLVTLRRRGEPRTDCLALLQARAVSRGVAE